MDNRITDNIRKLCGISAGMQPNEFSIIEVPKVRMAELCDEVDKEYEFELSNSKSNYRVAANVLGYLIEICKALDIDYVYLSANEMCEKAIEYIKRFGNITEKERSILNMWPRFENEEPVMFSDVTTANSGQLKGEEFTVKTVIFKPGGVTLRDKACGHCAHLHSGERVKCSALAADGKSVHVGGYCWWVCCGDEQGIRAEKMHIDAIDQDGFLKLSLVNGKGTDLFLMPSEIYAEKPILTSDGKPAKAGELVWNVDGKTPAMHVIEVNPDIEYFPISVETNDGTRLELPGDILTHEQPDSWEKWREDANFPLMKYVLDVMGEEKPDDPIEARKMVIRDLERRAKALCERDVK